MEVLEITWAWRGWQYWPSVDRYPAWPDGDVIWFAWLGLDLQIKIRDK